MVGFQTQKVLGMRWKREKFLVLIRNRCTELWRYWVTCGNRWEFFVASFMNHVFWHRVCCWKGKISWCKVGQNHSNCKHLLDDWRGLAVCLKYLYSWIMCSYCWYLSFLIWRWSQNADWMVRIYLMNRSWHHNRLQYSWIWFSLHFKLSWNFTNW